MMKGDIEYAGYSGNDDDVYVSVSMWNRRNPAYHQLSAFPYIREHQLSVFPYVPEYDGKTFWLKSYISSSSFSIFI